MIDIFGLLTALQLYRQCLNEAIGIKVQTKI